MASCEGQPAAIERLRYPQVCRLNDAESVLIGTSGRSISDLVDMDSDRCLDFDPIACGQLVEVAKRGPIRGAVATYDGIAWLAW